MIDTNKTTTSSTNASINPDPDPKPIPDPDPPTTPGVIESTYDVWEVRMSQNTGFGDTVPIVEGIPPNDRLEFMISSMMDSIS